MSKKSTSSYATAPITKARTIEEMAEIYQVSVETFKAQIEGHKVLWDLLLKSNFMGSVFFPKQQLTVFRHLGDIDKIAHSGSVESDRETGHDVNKRKLY